MDRKRVCCNCGHNIRSGPTVAVECHCDIDGHRIGYVECFEHWCRRWCRDKYWDAFPATDEKSMEACEGKYDYVFEGES